MFAQQENIAATVRTSVNIMMPLSFVVAVSALFFGDEIMQFLYHKASAEGDGKIFALLMWSFPAYCLMYIYSTLLTAKGNIQLLNKISVVIVAINLLLHYVLITQYQAAGAAITVVITEWLVAALVIYFAHRQCRLPHNYKWLAMHLGFVLTLLFLAYSVTFLPLGWMKQLGILLMGSLLLLFVFRFWTWANIKELLARKA
jgi:O-antigen/teichoic acid export membrane protein